jgi:antitoxin ChpS
MSVDLMQPPTNEAVRTALSRFAEELRSRYGDRLTGLHLFGSRARGDFKPFSDVDVAVILENGAESLDGRMDLYNLAYDILVETGAEIQPWPFSTREWADPSASESPALLRSLKRDSQPVWVRR